MKRFLVQKKVGGRYCKHADYDQQDSALICARLLKSYGETVRVKDRETKQYFLLEDNQMKKFTFAFYPNGQLAEIRVIAETQQEAAKLVREMIHDQYFDDGLCLNDEEDYK